VARSQELSRSIYIREVDAAISFNEVVAFDGFFPLKRPKAFIMFAERMGAERRTKK